MGHWPWLFLRAEDGKRPEVEVWTKKFFRLFKSIELISNDFRETYGAQIQKEHIETRRMDMVMSKSVQIWTRTEEITESETDTFECQGAISEVP